MSDRTTLFCLVHGDNPVNRAFSVNVSNLNTVDELKKLIKTEKQPEFDNIAADKLTLWRVNISQDELPELDAGADPETLGKKLSPLSKIGKVFPDRAAEKHIHIIVVRPAVAHEDLAFDGLGFSRWYFCFSCSIFNTFFHS